jgi:general stress protein YciG
MADTSNRGLGSDKMDPQTKHDIQSQGGQASGGNFANDPQKASEAGEKGGRSAQQSGNAHELTSEERSEGGSNSGGNFANDPQRASEAGMKGGSNS